jgi:hypothetical protein
MDSNASDTNLDEPAIIIDSVFIGIYAITAAALVY